MTAPVAVVAGASGGLGRALADGLRRNNAYGRVFALSRQCPHGWPEHDWIAVNILDEMTLAAAADQLRAAGPLTRIIVASGLLHGPGLEPEKSMRALTLDAMMGLFAVNAAGPALVAKHLLPLTPRDRPSLFAALSARVGSIGDNTLGGWYSYRASKAALNMLIRTLAMEHRRTRPLGVCSVLHPGTVDTALSLPFQANGPDGKLFTPTHAATALLAVMEQLGPEDSGGFFAWDGRPIPW